MAGWGRRAHKYNAKRTEVDGLKFDSKREANRWLELKLLERAKKIDHLDRQVSVPLIVEGKKICTWRVDFYYRQDGQWVADDTKGFRTPEYKLKRKLFEALHPGIKVVES